MSAPAWSRPGRMTCAAARCSACTCTRLGAGCGPQSPVKADPVTLANLQATPQRGRKTQMTERTGSCLCGNVQYRLTAEPVVTRLCWCRDCQHISSNGTVNAIFPTSSIEVSGSPGEYVRAADSGHQVRRRFCSQCGCHLFADSTGRPLLAVVRVGTLQNPSSVKPTANIWSASAPAWACLDPGLVRIERQPSPPPAPLRRAGRRIRAR